MKPIKTSIISFLLMVAMLSSIATTVVNAQDSDPDIGAICAQIDQSWASDWLMVIDGLEQLVSADVDCVDGRPSEGILYAAYVNYAVELTNNGQSEDAILQYQKALLLHPDGSEALNGLTALGGVLPEPPPLETCSTDVIETALSSVPAYQETTSRPFITIDGDQFVADSAQFTPIGVNYYPSRAPWRRFLLETDLATVEADFSRFQQTGMNTIRIFLWYEALFMCAGNGAIPQPDRFALLDGIIHSAAKHDLYLIVTLHDLPDLIWYPLYDDLPHIQAQTAFILERYQYESNIMAWDVRNEGDIDYNRYGQNKDTVYEWLGVVAERVREAAPKHLITAGWLDDAELTDPYVDFLSFHHWTSADELRWKVSTLRSATDKPILLGEFGFSTFTTDEETQRDLLEANIQAASDAGVIGWLVWTAYDFPTDVTCLPAACPSQENFEHHMGLWKTDGTPKLAVELIASQAQVYSPTESPLDFRLIVAIRIGGLIVGVSLMVSFVWFRFKRLILSRPKNA